jgi:hypothetical protein
LRTPNPFVIV